MKDLLLYYNEKDVDLLLSALHVFLELNFAEFKIDLLNLVSLPQTSWMLFLKQFHNSKKYPLYYS